MNKEKAFTLVELMLVISIIGLLSSVIMVSLGSAREKAKTAKSIQFDASIYHSLGADIVGMWNFDDQLSPATDASGYRRNGTLNGPPIYRCSGNYTPSGKGCSLEFDGDDYINVGTINISSEITVSAWVYSSDFNQSGFIVGKNPVNTQWELFFEGGFLKWRGGEVNPEILCSIPSNNKWHHVVGAQKGTTGYIFIDGVQCAKGNVVLMGNDNQAINTVEIGRFNSGYYFVGLIDEVRIYEQALFSSQIKKLYAEGTKERDLLVKKD